MTAINEEHLNKLRAAGLFVSKPFPSKHPFPDGVLVGKPVTTTGNNLPNYKTGYGLDSEKDSVAVDAPFVRLYCHKGKSVVDSVDYIPTPGPGDFVNEWSSIEEALDDILDFFLGDPARMLKKPHALVKKEVL
jgi:hypothetical protein